MSPWKFSTNYYFSYHSNGVHFKSTRMISWNDRVSFFLLSHHKMVQNVKADTKFLKEILLWLFNPKTLTGTSSKMKTRWRPLNRTNYCRVSLGRCHKNSFVFFFVIIPNTFSKSCVLFGHHFSGQQIETSILPRVVLANEINKKYFFSNECLLVVVWKKTKSLSRIIIILIPRVHFNHINPPLQYADKGLELEKPF